MKRYFMLLALISIFFLIVYLIAEAFKVPVITNPEPLMSAAGITSALAGVALLVADVILPVPSSIVMVAHGSLFGIVVGTILSLIGRAGSFSLGYYLGTHSDKLVRKFINEDDLAKSSQALKRWGLVAIVGTRPLPIISETTSIAAGVSRISFGWSITAAIMGSLPEALLFAVTGAIAGTFINTSYVFIAIVLVMLFFWVISTKIKTTQAS